MPDTEKTTDIAALTVQLLSAYLANNTVASEDLSGLIRSTKAALTDDAAVEPVTEEAPTYTPAVSVRKSQASSEHLLSLIDGKPYKTLKRHLASHGLTPEAYRERYNLPASYPMVAPDFTAKRRAIAEKIGLGSRKQAAVDEPVAVTDVPVSETKAPASAVASDTMPVSATADTSQTIGRTAKKQRSPIIKPSGTVGEEHPAATAPADGAASADTPKALKVRQRKSKPLSSPELKTKTATDPAAEPTTTASARKRAPGRKTKAAEPAAVAKSGKQNAETPAVASAPVEPPANVAADIPAPASPKRRGKIGLFGKGGAANKESTPGAPETELTADKMGEAAKVKTPARAGKPKRMARPKAT
ncbi:MucR family transcriptional regulator [Novosphingobium resinovorum]|uniref:MucR family transcriptional regulator n=1 Tax=Novosphingobium TaxID=165696 RepID=UPI001B3CA29A|nr:MULTISPECIES: MucR family transcriptional regulator [Novosphingobium]MBF7013673.1 MucR family transcriptional regulator [Novosphingobium sp. HR1a]WJM25822.1 MucR family transcriptional regulator [Novosphingobium resinovorum]